MFQALGDRLHHAVNIVKHVVVPKSQDGETLRPKPGIPLIVTLRLCSVLSTINLDNPSVETPIDLVPHKARKRDINIALSNSFGFGGTNASLIFSRYAN